MVLCCRVFRTSHKVASHATPPLASAQAARAEEALATLVHSCYPTASVVFTHGCALERQQKLPSVSGGFDDVRTHLQSTLAYRGGLHGEAIDTWRLLARMSWGRSSGSETSEGVTTDKAKQWWEVFLRLSPPEKVYASLFSSKLNAHSCSSSFFCPDAVIYIDGVEVSDIAAVVAPRIVRDIPDIVSVDRVGSKAHTHAGQRQEPTYCRRKVKWEAYWREKRCAMRGVDLLELSLPVQSESGCDGQVFSRESLLVSVANPSVTLASLHRQKNSQRRGALRSSFGYSLPCLQRALPVAVVHSVRLLRAWQQRETQKCAPCTSAFWVSAVGHLLEVPVVNETHNPIRAVAEEWLGASAEKENLTEAETQLLHALTHTSDTVTEDSFGLSESDRAQLLSSLLFAAVVKSVLDAPPKEWNAQNYFLPSESFEGTTDIAGSATLLNWGKESFLSTRSELKDLLAHT